MSYCNQFRIISENKTANIDGVDSNTETNTINSTGICEIKTLYLEAKIITKILKQSTCKH